MADSLQKMAQWIMKDFDKITNNKALVKNHGKMVCFMKVII